MSSIWDQPTTGTAVSFATLAPLPRSGTTPVTAARAAELAARRGSTSPDVRKLQAVSDAALGGGQ